MPALPSSSRLDQLRARISRIAANPAACLLYPELPAIADELAGVLACVDDLARRIAVLERVLSALRGTDFGLGCDES